MSLALHDFLEQKATLLVEDFCKPTFLLQNQNSSAVSEGASGLESGEPSATFGA